MLALCLHCAPVRYDSDVEVFGDVTPVFRCAAQNYVLSTSGPNAPLNMGFLAFKPSQGFKAVRAHSHMHGQSARVFYQSQITVFRWWLGQCL